MKRLSLVFLAMLVGLEVSAGPYIPIKCNFEDNRANQFNIQTAVANTPTIQATLWQGTNLFTNTTGYGVIFRFSQSDRSSSMSTINGTLNGAVASFEMLPTTFQKSFNNWYAVVVLTDTLHAKYYSFSRGLLSVRAAPEFSAPSFVYQVLGPLNGSLYGPFIGDFSAWPFVLKSSYLGGYVQSQDYADTQTYWNARAYRVDTQKLDKVEFYNWTNKIAVAYSYSTNTNNLVTGYVQMQTFSDSTGDIHRQIGSNLVYLGGVSGRVVQMEGRTQNWDQAWIDVQAQALSKLNKSVWDNSTAGRIVDSDTQLWNTVANKLDYSVWVASVASGLIPQDLIDIH
jgi:hypothetical protein